MPQTHTNKHTHKHTQTQTHTNTHMLNRYCTLLGNHSVHTAWQSLSAIPRCTLLGPLPTATPQCTAHLGRCLRSRESECESRSSWFRGHNSCRHSTWTTRHQKPLDMQCNAGCDGLCVWLGISGTVCFWLFLCGTLALWHLVVALPGLSASTIRLWIHTKR